MSKILKDYDKKWKPYLIPLRRGFDKQVYCECGRVAINVMFIETLKHVLEGWGHFPNNLYVCIECNKEWLEER